MKLKSQTFAGSFGEEMGLISHWAIWLEMLFGIMVIIWAHLSQSKRIAEEDRETERDITLILAFENLAPTMVVL